MAVYGPVRHQKNIIWTSKNIIWTSEASVHIIFICWRTGPYTAIWPSVPWTICYIYLFFSLGFDIHVLWIVIIPLSNKNGNGILKLSFFKYNVVENFIYFFTLDSTNKWCWYMYCFFLITQPCLALPPICACPLYIFISQWYRGTWFPTSYV